jgi:hypothetical protein
VSVELRPWVPVMEPPFTRQVLSSDLQIMDVVVVVTDMRRLVRLE